jgi:DNA-binding SARP family transcriptional activator
VGVSVEMPVETDGGSQTVNSSRLGVRLLGALAISRNDVTLVLPPSRKVRALFAYLSLAPQAVTRRQLCDLLWDVPNDPRGELRWCLSKIRGIIDEPGRRRVEAHGEAIRLDLSDCRVDAIEITRAIQDGIGTCSVEQMRVLSALFAGDFLDGLDIDRAPAFDSWLVAQRRRFRACHAALLEQLVKSVPDGEELFHLERWRELAPFDPRVHEILLRALARRGRIREGEEHLAATIRLFEADGLDCTPISDVWRMAKAQGAAAPRVQTIDLVAATASNGAPANLATPAPRRASIAVMPFADRDNAANAPGSAADGLAHDVITRLAKLRTLFVIAQGTVFSLHERHIGPEEAGRILNVDYIVSGSLRMRGNRFTVSVELAETRTARIIWTEVFDQKLDDTFLVLDEIGNRIVASVASEIEAVERNRAVLRAPNSLDAWEAYHRGLWHMYRFNRVDNERAQHFLETAVHLDPTFARAYAGLSFVHFQNAFVGYVEREKASAQALEAAGQSLGADDRDPAAHSAMGRALWLRGSLDQSVIELERAIDLSPSFAFGHYSLSFVQAQTGDPRAAIRSNDHSRNLSPFDPILAGMFVVRARALVRLREFDEAAHWAVKAAARPNTHAHVLATAACSLALAGRIEEAIAYVARIRGTTPHYRVNDLTTALQFAPDAATLLREGAKRIGFD